MTDWRSYVRTRLPKLAAIRAERESEIIDELALQLEAAYETAVAEGASEKDALRRAAAEVPDWESLARDLVRVESRPVKNHVRPIPALAIGKAGALTGFALDLRYAMRRLAAAPVHSAIALVTLSFALGLGTVAFSLVDGVLMRPLPYREADRLALIKATTPDGRDTAELTYPDSVDLAATSTAFRSMAALLPFAGTTTMTEPPSRVE